MRSFSFAKVELTVKLDSDETKVSDCFISPNEAFNIIEEQEGIDNFGLKVGDLVECHFENLTLMGKIVLQQNPLDSFFNVSFESLSKEDRTELVKFTIDNACEPPWKRTMPRLTCFVKDKNTQVPKSAMVESDEGIDSL